MAICGKFIGDFYSQIAIVNTNNTQKIHGCCEPTNDHVVMFSTITSPNSFWHLHPDSDESFWKGSHKLSCDISKPDTGSVRSYNTQKNDKIKNYFSYGIGEIFESAKMTTIRLED